MRILNFGSCNVDHVYRLPRIVRTGETATSASLSLFPGGKGLNQSVAAARAGAKVFHAAPVGTDGDLLLAELAAASVDLSLVKRVDVPNGHAVIQVSDAGENAIFVYDGSNSLVTDAYIEEVLSGFGADDLLLLQNELAATGKILAAAGKKSIPVLFNPSPVAGTERLDLSPVTYLIVNETEATALFGTDDPARLFPAARKRAPHAAVILTLGEKGAVYLSESEKFSLPARPVKAVDTTGAGDTFLGYFAAMLAAGRSPREAMETATAAASIAVSRPGASPSIPRIDEVTAVMAAGERKKI